MDLSIIIVSYNCVSQLIDCLRSISSMSSIRYEIICVDNCSSDNTISKVQKRFPTVRWILNDRNLGFSAANNQGAQIATGEYLLFLNPDTILLEHAVETALGFAKNHSNVGVVGAKLLNEDGSLQPSCSSFPSLWGYFLESTFLYHLFGKSKMLKNGIPVIYKYDRRLQVDIVKGAFFGVRKKVFDDLGGFDENFFMYSEEDDFCYRAQKRGWDTVVIPECEVIHLGGQSAKPIWSKMFVEQHKSKIIFFLKHHGTSRTLIVAVFLFSGVALRLVIWAVAALAAILVKYEKKIDILAKFENYLAALVWYLRFGFRKILTS